MSSTNEMGQGRATLSAAAGRVADARRDFDGLDHELVQHLDTARARWSGQGAAAFTALGRAWSERQRTITQALDGFEASLRSTERDNTTTDEAQSAAFTRSRQRLG
jgi:WXG100 family type VII secretion target